MTPNLYLRPILQSDLPIFFEHQKDRDAVQMAAFVNRDPQDEAAFYAHWEKIFANPEVDNRTIVWNDQIVGNVCSFMMFGDREVGYWIGKEFWGKGIASLALTKFLVEIKTRPLHAHAAKDNYASIRVLEKCGFELVGYDHGFAKARGVDIEEAILVLKS